MLKRCVGLFLAGVFELYQSFVAVIWHGEVYLAFVVVKIQCDSIIFLALPIFVHLIEFLKNLDKVVGVFFAHVLHPKIIHYKAETDGRPVVLPKSRCLITVAVPVLDNRFFKEFLGNNSCMW